MAQQEGGWPLGLQPLNLRVGVVRNRDYLSGSTSFNTLLSESPASSTDSSSDLDSESTGSFFHDRSTTLGSLIGVSRIVNLSRRSTRGRPSSVEANQVVGKKYTRRPGAAWCFSLCPRNSTDGESAIRSNTASLGHFLAVERRAGNGHRRSHHSPLIYGPDEYALVQHDRESSNSLFANDRIAPPQLSPWAGRAPGNRSLDTEQDHQGVPLVLFPCICG
ncbi:PREDICTED: uncharacterized protein At3g17950-like [Ipomoea nil]|uniref:uncharacterized protein At3g17950-like n=1 Tax=Ipomoea nil TaxID=35883 RepID=UPI0009013DA8|nr:PREDICTED: uncharacterized protein At3g17950-like [Ipomoea nil]XP_019199025.1 PREDICTED: uncharacterized protein At3g17950-like [Ipomoea nil]XP_019199026.1 PREDICTED: uncharacterized protein At3g17950-like [Ipomoea nil]XP_019199027.1 PREDICTED: uncharacterized protein At3g17950-like [Ipomoea nil]XP_019199028.1 PREDICTED: uncharacterized protein At3g17950-like [Ipomoea nil]